MRYLFRDTGVYHIPGNTFMVSNASQLHGNIDTKNALVLLDLNEEQFHPRRFSNWKLIVASSPQPARYKEWRKQRPVKTFVMKPWSWSEIYIARYAVFTSDVPFLVNMQVVIVRLSGVH